MGDAPRVLTVFRSRLADGAYDAGYEERADEMLATAQAMPGFVEFKSFTAADGERVSVIQFESQDDHDAWARHLDHRAAQAEGRESVLRRVPDNGRLGERGATMAVVTVTPLA